MSKRKSIDWFPARNWIGDVTVKSVGSDLLAGLTGSIIVLPQGVAFAIIAGLPPIHGLYAAMIVPIVAAFFGSSRHLISGPTVAISLIVFSTVSHYAEPSTPEFVSLAIIVTLVAGLIQLLLGLAKMGAIVNFVSRSVIIGFTAGAAILIASSQLNYILGIDIPRGVPFIDILITLFQRIDEIILIVLGIGLCALITAILFKLIHPMVPNLLLAMLFSSFVAYYFFNGESSVVLVGELPQGLPQFKFPKLNIEQFKTITPNAFAIALLGLIQSVAIGRSIAANTEQRINANQEFIGQGLSNIFSSFFSGYAGSGSFTRSAINKSAGAVTPMASMFSALFLLLAISYIGPLAAYLPISVMAGLIILVAYGLIDFQYIRKLLLTSKRESSVMIITFLSVLFLEVDYAIYFGVFFSLVLYLRQTTQPRFVQISPDPDGPRHMFLSIEKYSLSNRLVHWCVALMIIGLLLHNST